VFPGTWTVVSFTLPADAGRDAPETLTFQQTAVDDLGNRTSAVLAPNSYEVYQGTLPALSPPSNLKADSRPAERFVYPGNKSPRGRLSGLPSSPGESTLPRQVLLPSFPRRDGGGMNLSDEGWFPS